MEKKIVYLNELDDSLRYRNDEIVSICSIIHERDVVDFLYDLYLSMGSYSTFTTAYSEHRDAMVFRVRERLKELGISVIRYVDSMKTFQKIGSIIMLDSCDDLVYFLHLCNYYLKYPENRLHSIESEILQYAYHKLEHFGVTEELLEIPEVKKRSALCNIVDDFLHHRTYDNLLNTITLIDKSHPVKIFERKMVYI